MESLFFQKKNSASICGVLFKFLSTLHIVSFLDKFLVLCHQVVILAKHPFQNPKY